jgi:phytoene synthase
MIQHAVTGSLRDQQIFVGMRRAKTPATLPAYQARALLRQVIDNPMIVANGQMGLSEFDRRRRLLWAALTGRV